MMRALALLALLASLAALCTAGCDDDPPPITAPPGPGRYGVYSLAPDGDLLAFRCDTYSLQLCNRNRTLTATVGDVLTQPQDAPALVPGAQVTLRGWVVLDFWSGALAHG